MKNWTKTALLTGCACCIAGAVLMFSGWASGGKAYAETYDLNAMSGSATEGRRHFRTGKDKDLMILMNCRQTLRSAT